MDNQQTLQQESVTELTTVVPLQFKRIFYGTFVKILVSTHFPDGTFVMARGTVGTTTTVLFISY